jgi:hypothetical protein
MLVTPDGGLLWLASRLIRFEQLRYNCNNNSIRPLNASRSILIQRDESRLLFRFSNASSLMGWSISILSRFSFFFSPPLVASASLYPTLRFKIGNVDRVFAGLSPLLKFNVWTLTRSKQAYRGNSERLIHECQRS